MLCCSALCTACMATPTLSLPLVCTCSRVVSSPSQAWYAADARQIAASNTILNFMSTNPNITGYGDMFTVGSHTDDIPGTLRYRRCTAYRHATPVALLRVRTRVRKLAATRTRGCSTSAAALDLRSSCHRLLVFNLCCFPPQVTGTTTHPNHAPGLVAMNAGGCGPWNCIANKRAVHPARTAAAVFGYEIIDAIISSPSSPAYLVRFSSAYLCSGLPVL